MTNTDPAAELEAILAAENEALRRQDAAAAVAMLDAKLAAANALAAPIGTEQASRLRALADENRELLEHAIDIQSRIIALVARAAQSKPDHVCYGAEGRTIRGGSALALARQA